MLLLLQYTLIFASVLMLVALGGCFAERSGVINIGLEGIMVIGALGGALVLKFLPVSVGPLVMVLGTVLASALLGMLYSLLLAVAAISFKADQTITGTAMNMLATAGATVAVKAMNTAASLLTDQMSMLEKVKIIYDYVTTTISYDYNKFIFFFQIFGHIYRKRKISAQMFTHKCSIQIYCSKLIYCAKMKKPSFSSFFLHFCWKHSSIP